MGYGLIGIVAAVALSLWFSFDVLLTTASADVVSAYSVKLLAGDIEFDGSLMDALCQTLQHGSRDLTSVRQKRALGADWEAPRSPVAK